jgi:mono/diheme cytochrome c family protein
MMGGNLFPDGARRSRNRTRWLLATSLALAVGACDQETNTAATPAEGAEEEEMEFLEFAGAPEEIANANVNDIVKSLRLNATAMRMGQRGYDASCASCHGADLAGTRAQNAPNLTDANWLFSGDDLETGGVVKLPSDVEWTVLYGIRTEHPRTRGLEADMVAYLPEYRNDHDKEAYGTERFLSDEQIDEVAEYVMQISGQTVADQAKADRGRALFMDTANCFDCHGDDGTGNEAFGSTNLTKPELYLFGSDRAKIVETIVQGRRGTMPAFEGQPHPFVDPAVWTQRAKAAQVNALKAVEKEKQKGAGK